MWLISSAFVVSTELAEAVRSSSVYASLFVDRWPWWAGGVAMAVTILAMLYFDDKQLGVSSGCAELCSLGRDPEVRKSWRPRFLLGIVLGGALSAVLAGRAPTLSMGTLEQLAGGDVAARVALLLGSGVLIGFGARLAGGCTSGHGIVGTALGARSSWLATALFMLAGFVTTHVFSVLQGG